MSAMEKVAVLAQVETIARRKRQALMALGIPKSSYYRWRQGQPDSVTVSYTHLTLPTILLV